MLEISAGRKRVNKPTRKSEERTARNTSSRESSSTARTSETDRRGTRERSSEPARTEAPRLTSRFSDEIRATRRPEEREPSAETSRAEEGEESRGGFLSGVVDGVRGVVEEVTDQVSVSDEAQDSSEGEESDEGGSFLGNIFNGLRDGVEGLAERAAERREQERLEAAEAYQEWSQDPDGLAGDLAGTDLTELSNGERIALFQLTQEHEGVSSAANDALRDTFENIESFSDIPDDQGFQALLASGTNEELDERLSGLLSEELSSGLSGLLEDASGDGDADRALDRFIGDIEDIARTRPGLAHLLEDQATSVLEGASDRISDVRRDDDSIFQRVNHAVTGFARGAAGFVGDRLRDIGDIAGTALDGALDFAGDLQEFTIDTVGTVAGGAADLVGADGVADNIRDGADRLGDAVDAGYDFVGEQSGNFTRGFTEGAAGAVEGVTELVVNPVGTVQALGTLVQDPSLILDSYRAIADEHGVAGAAGAVAFEVLSTVATGGGGAAARVSSAAGRAATFLDDVGRVGRVAGLADNAAGLIDNVAGLTDNVAGLTDNVAGLTDNVAGLTDNIAGLTDDVAGLTDNVGGLTDNVAGLTDDIAGSTIRSRVAGLGADGFRVVERAADGVHGLTQPLRNGVSRGVDAVAESALGRTVRNGVSGAVELLPDGVRHPISRFRRGVNDLLTGDDSAEFAARSQRVRSANPDLQPALDALPDTFADLKNNLDGLDAAGQRQVIRELIDADGDLAGLAQRFDDLAAADGIGSAPGGIGDNVVQGRVEILNYVRENLKDLDPQATRRILRGLFTDGDAVGPAFLTRLGADDQIFRAFDATGTADGGYFSRVSDARLDSAGQRRASALPGNNQATGGVVAQIGEDSLAVVTRISDQTANLADFGEWATGGGWQIQLFNDGNLRNRLADVATDVASLPDGVRLVDPGRLTNIQRATEIARALGQFAPPALIAQLDNLEQISQAQQQ